MSSETRRAGFQERLGPIALVAIAAGGVGSGWVAVGCAQRGEPETDPAADTPVGASGDESSEGEPAATGGDGSPSLLGDAEPGSTFVVSGVSLDYSELAALDGASDVGSDYGAIISPVLADSLDGDLSRYRSQVQHVVNRLHNEGQPKRVHLLGATYRDLPRLDGGVSIVATVLINNRSSDRITDIVIDADLKDSAGATVADGRFVLGRSLYGEVPASTMMLANLIFPPARVADEAADLLDRPQLIAEVNWEVVS